ncbi:hypothetical protein BJF85_13985 [Saccharomonospora sp. CUA-673]|nr:hypothetical protein BJF85_13985 [Saccharomonospora sp. CUA-673]
MSTGPRTSPLAGGHLLFRTSSGLGPRVAARVHGRLVRSVLGGGALGSGVPRGLVRAPGSTGCRRPGCRSGRALCSTQPLTATVRATNGHDSAVRAIPRATTSPAHHRAPNTTTRTVYWPNTHTQLASE